MSDDRPPPSTLKGRLADVYVPALVTGALDGLSRRLGNRATVDDPLYGRASSLASLDPLIGKVSAWLVRHDTTYRHVASTTGVDRDVSEGSLRMVGPSGPREVPIAVVAERRRLREIELRVYYMGAEGRTARPPLVHGRSIVLPPLVTGILDALRTGNVAATLAAFEESGQLVDARGGVHAKSSGALATHLERLGSLEILMIGGAADDGRTSCLEGAMRRPGGDPSAAMIALERGDSGLIREARLYWD